MPELEIPAADGVNLKAVVFEHPTATGVAIIHGATGVPFRYYAAFAEWYSGETGRHVYIYEYRDSGPLNRTQIRASKVTMADWGILDQSAVLDHAIARYPDLPVHTIGHSLGGFCIPFHENAHRITSHVGVNSGLAYWPRHPWHYLPQVILFWFVLGPLATLILGYLPGVLLGMKANLPSGVYWQWRRWCTNERLHEIDWGTRLPMPDPGKFTGDLIIVGASDDAIIPWERVTILDRFFPNAQSVERVLLDPANYGLNTIGHIAIFSPAKSATWKQLIR